MSRFPTESAQPSGHPAAPTGALGWPRFFDRAMHRARARSPHFTLYLGAKELLSWNMNQLEGIDAALSSASASGLRTSATSSSSSLVAPAPKAFENFEAWCAAHEGAQARICVSGHLLHSLVADPALRLRDEAAVRDYASQQFTHYHGTQAQRWPLAVWWRGANAGASAGACALHSLDLPALQAAAARHRVRLRSIAPAWSAGLTSLAMRRPSFAGPGLHALALVEGTLLTWLVAEAGRIVALQQRYLDAPRTDALADLLDRLSAEGSALAEPPLVIGWGLDDTGHASLPRADVLGPLGDPLAAGAWMLDSMNAAA